MTLSSNTFEFFESEVTDIFVRASATIQLVAHPLSAIVNPMMKRPSLMSMVP